MRLNGWWRLWIALSTLSALSVLLAACPEYPTPELYQRNAWVVVGTHPDSAIIAGAFKVAEAQSRPEQIDAYRDVWWLQNGVLATIPAVLLGVLFFIIAWVRGGFSRRRPGVPA